MANRPSRKLAVFLHADVVGSTALVQKDESLAHERIQDTFQRLSNVARTYGGTVHEIRGDALVGEFSRASDAVCAALVFQSENVQYNQTLAGEIRPEVRIGISLGEAVVADGTVTGAGVVLAQRLEQLADPSGLVVQGSVSETVPTRLPFEYASLGEQSLKGFDQPVRALRVRLKAGESIPEPDVVSVTSELTRRPSADLPDKPSIAVLPFVNLTNDPEQEFFSDGLTEDIITALSRISGLLVVARNSTMIYKTKAVDVRQIGREQGVHFVLEGSVRRSANRIRVSAQLIDATTGHHQWADHYDRDISDVFAVQDDITHKIVVEMRVQISVGEKARILAGRTQSIAAWEQLLRADELQSHHIKGDNLQARQLLEKALRVDPRYACAWTELGWTHYADAYFGWTESREHSENSALEAAETALDLEKDYPNALALLGLVNEIKGDHDRAIELTERAATLAPSSAENTALFARVLTFAGQPNQAIEMFKRAMRLSPIYPAWYLVGLGICYYLKNEQDAAIRTLQRAISMEPASALPRFYLTSAYIEAELLQAAKQIAQEILSIERNLSVKELRKGVAQFKETKSREKMIENLIKAGLPE